MEGSEKSPPVRARIALLCFAWLAVVLAFVSKWGINGVSYPWLFPMGLAFFPIGNMADFFICMFGGWLYYAVLIGLALIVRRRVGFVMVLSVLCLTLALNVAGCFASWNVGP